MHRLRQPGALHCADIQGIFSGDESAPERGDEAMTPNEPSTQTAPATAPLVEFLRPGALHQLSDLYASLPHA